MSRTTCICMCHCVCWSQRTICRSQSSPFTVGSRNQTQVIRLILLVAKIHHCPPLPQANLNKNTVVTLHIFFFFTFIYLGKHTCIHVMSEGNFQMSVLSFYHLGHRYQTRVLGLSNKCFYLLGHPAASTNQYYHLFFLSLTKYQLSYMRVSPTHT